MDEIGQTAEEIADLFNRLVEAEDLHEIGKKFGPDAVAVAKAQIRKKLDAATKKDAPKRRSAKVDVKCAPRNSSNNSVTNTEQLQAMRSRGSFQHPSNAQVTEVREFLESEEPSMEVSLSKGSGRHPTLGRAKKSKHTAHEGKESIHETPFGHPATQSSCLGFALQSPVACDDNESAADEMFTTPRVQQKVSALRSTKPTDDIINGQMESLSPRSCGSVFANQTDEVNTSRLSHLSHPTMNLVSASVNQKSCLGVVQKSDNHFGGYDAPHSTTRGPHFALHLGSPLCDDHHHVVSGKSDQQDTTPFMIVPFSTFQESDTQRTSNGSPALNVSKQEDDEMKVKYLRPRFDGHREPNPPSKLSSLPTCYFLHDVLFL